MPAEGLEERIEEFAAELGFVVLRRAVGILVALETLSQFTNFGGHAHFVELTTERRRAATNSPSRRPRHRALMPPQDKPVIHALGLVVFQRRQVSQRG